MKYKNLDTVIDKFVVAVNDLVDARDSLKENGLIDDEEHWDLCEVVRSYCRKEEILFGINCDIKERSQ